MTEGVAVHDIKIYNEEGSSKSIKRENEFHIECVCLHVVPILAFVLKYLLCRETM